MPLPAILAAALPLFAGLAGRGIDRLAQARTAKYNSPMAQAQRLQQAGFSKNAMFQGLSNTGLMGDMPASNLPTDFYTEAITALAGSDASTQQARAHEVSSDLNKLELDFYQDSQTEDPSTNMGQKLAAEVSGIQLGNLLTQEQTGTQQTTQQLQQTQATKTVQDTATSKSQEALNQANTRVADMKPAEIKAAIDNMQAELTNIEKRAGLIESQTKLTDLQGNEQARATKFLASMENYEKVKMSMDISSIAEHISRSQDAEKGRRDMIQNMRDEGGNLSTWDITKLYLYDMFRGIGGTVTSQIPVPTTKK